MKELKTMPRMHSIEDYVRFYYDVLGLKVIPLKAKSKKPNLDSWEEYQSRRPTREEIQKWLTEGKFGNIGLICGKIRDSLYFYVIDVEDRQNYEKFFYDHETIEQNTIVVKTGGGGYHVWFFTTKPVHLDKKRFHEDADLDIQLDGTYVVAPPSIHPETEKPYEIYNNWDKYTILNDLEKPLIQRIRKTKVGNIQSSMKEISQGVSEGMRETSAFRYSCFLLNWKGLDENATMQELQEWNSMNNPPLSDSEIEHAVQSALRYSNPQKIIIDPKVREEAMQLLKNGDIWKRLIESSDKRIVEDKLFRKLVYLDAVSALTTAPINLAVLGRASIGKTFVATNILQYVPEEYVVYLGDMSPTALVHESGTYDEQREETIVDLQKKILAFMETPNPATLGRLKPLLSHDRFETTFKITDRTTSGKHRTKTVRLRGFPSVILCSAQTTLTNEEQRTRWLSLTPEISEEKTRKSIMKMAKAYDNTINTDEEKREIELFHNVFEVLAFYYPLDVIIPYAEILASHFEFTDPSAPRLFMWICNLIKANATLHMFQRKKDKKGKIIANLEDLKEIVGLAPVFITPTVKGVSGDAWLLYQALRDKKGREFATVDLINETKIILGDLDEKTIRNRYIAMLVNKGLLFEWEDPSDRRKNIYKVVESPQIKIFDDLETVYKECRNVLESIENYSPQRV